MILKDIFPHMDDVHKKLFIRLFVYFGAPAAVYVDLMFAIVEIEFHKDDSEAIKQ